MVNRVTVLAWVLVMVVDVQEVMDRVTVLDSVAVVMVKRVTVQD